MSHIIIKNSKKNSRKNSTKLMVAPPETDIIIQYMYRIIYTSLVVHNLYNNSIKYNNNHNNKINNKMRLITIYRTNNGRLHIHV